jgi:hypothetical protein
MPLRRPVRPRLPRIEHLSLFTRPGQLGLASPVKPSSVKGGKRATTSEILLGLIFKTLADFSSAWQVYDEDTWTSAGIAPVRRARESSNSYSSAVTEKECVVCTDTKAMRYFPQQSITEKCVHFPSTCLDCLRTHIKTEIDNKAWSDQAVLCPECREPLRHDDVQDFADAASFTKYLISHKNWLTVACSWCPEAHCT